MDQRIGTQSSLAGPSLNDNYQDKIVMTATADSIRLNYNLKGLNLNPRASNPLKINFLGKELKIVDINSDTSFLVEGMTRLYRDGDAFIDENFDDPRWIWNIQELRGFNPVIGIELDHNFRDGSDEPAIELSKCIKLPYNYASVCLDSLTDANYNDAFYNNALIELAEAVDLTSDSGVPGFSTVNTIHIGADKDSSITLSDFNNIKTDEIWLAFKNNNNNEISLFYKNRQNNNKKTFAYTSNNGRLEFKLMNNPATITYDNTNPEGIMLSIQDYRFSDQTKTVKTDLISKFAYIQNRGIVSLGKSKSWEEADEVQFCKVEQSTSGSGGGGGASCLNIGIKDENHRTKYGIIIKDPKSNGASDRVELSIPDQQVKAKVSVKAYYE